MTGGTLKSAAGFAPGIDAEFEGVGNDYIHADADMKHCRLDAHGVLKYGRLSLAYFSESITNRVLLIGPKTVLYVFLLKGL